MRAWLYRGVLVAQLLLSSLAGGKASGATADWQAQLVVGADEAAQQRVYALVRSRPLTDNPTLVPWLTTNLRKLQPVFAFELSRRLFDENRAAALDWFTIARIRLRYAGLRCTDATAADGLAEAFLTRMAASIVSDYVAEHGEEELAALRRVVARGDALDDESSPAWACSRGMHAYGQALGFAKPLPDPVKPEQEWPAIRKAMLDELSKEVDATEARLKEQSASATAAALRPHAVPDAIAAGSRTDKIKAIGIEALATIEADPSPTRAHFQPTNLIDLAEAQTKVGDGPGARATLAELQHVLSATGATFGWDARIAALWVDAAAPAEAASYVATLANVATPEEALGKEGAALVRAGDLGAARQVLDLLEQSAQAAPAFPARPGQPRQRMPSAPLDLALKELGSALAQAHDTDSALRAEGLLDAVGQHVQLLSDIALAQCASTGMDAEEVLRRAQAAMQPRDRFAGPAQMEALGYVLALCHTPARAVAVVHEVIPDRQSEVLTGIARRLTEHGDVARARAIDEANSVSPEDISGLIELAERQIVRGDKEQARSNVAQAAARLVEVVGAARAANRPLGEILDTLRPTAGVVGAQAKLGLYAEAIRTSAVEDANNRPQTLIYMIEVAAERRDCNGLREIWPDVFDVIEKGMPGMAAHAPPRMAMALAKAGCDEAARKALAEADRLGRRDVEYATAQAALGDLAGAGTTIDNIPGSAVHRAQARFNLALGRADFATALAATATVTDGWRDDELGRLSEAQAKAGELTGAMSSAWAIDDLLKRGDALVKLLKNVPVR